MPDRMFTASLAVGGRSFVSFGFMLRAPAHLVDACADTHTAAPTARSVAPPARHRLTYRNLDRAERRRIPGGGFAPDTRITIASGATLPRDGLAPTGSGARGGALWQQ